MIWGDDDLRNTALNYITKPEHGRENETLKWLFTSERSCRRAEAVARKMGEFSRLRKACQMCSPRVGDGIIGYNHLL